MGVGVRKKRSVNGLAPQARLTLEPPPGALAWAKLKLRFGVAWTRQPPHKGEAGQMALERNCSEVSYGERIF